MVSKEMVSHIANLRRLAITAVQAHPGQDLGGGRLLVYFPDKDLADGAAETATNGYFDTQNTPPWDTWVAFVSERPTIWNPCYAQYLVAWVPPTFVELVKAGIGVNPEECIRWLDKSGIQFARALFEGSIRLRHVD
jgi:hypothetical protein